MRAVSLFKHIEIVIIGPLEIPVEFGQLVSVMPCVLSFRSCKKHASLLLFFSIFHLLQNRHFSSMTRFPGTFSCRSQQFITLSKRTPLVIRCASLFPHQELAVFDSVYGAI